MQRWATVMASLFLAAAGLHSAEHGTLTIVVTDTHGSFLEGASVKAVKLGASKGIELKSDKAGAVKFDLEIGDYGITVRAPRCAPDFTGGVRCRARSDFSNSTRRAHSAVLTWSRQRCTASTQRVGKV